MPLHLVFAIVFFQHTVSVETLAHEAQEAFQRGKYSEAREKLQRALQYSPRDSALWSYLGLTDVQLNDLDSGVADFQRALSFRPKDPQTHFNLGLLYRRKAMADKALEMYQEGLALAPDDPAGNQNCALLLMEAGRFREAIAPLQKLKLIRSSDLSVRTALIESYSKGGMKDEGEEEIRGFLAAANSSAAEQLKLARVLLEDKLPDAAQRVLEHVVEASPDSAEAHAKLGMLLLDKNQYEDSTRELGQAVQLDPDSAQYSMQLAEVLILWKHYPTALEFLAAVKDRFGTLPEYRYKTGLSYYGLHQFPQAIAEFDRIAREQPRLDLIQYFLGNSYMAMGELKKAEPYYKRAIELNPRNASYYSSLAQLLRKQSDDRTDEAVTHLEKALLLDPADTQSKQELALCYEKKMDYARAQALLEEVIRRQPDSAAAHVALARVFYRQKNKQAGDRERAIVSQLESEEQVKHSQSR